VAHSHSLSEHSAHSALAHHFENLEQQRDATTLGMWLFLVTEIMFFGGLFTGYIVYRSWYPEAFGHASTELNVTLGAINTAILICSSLTMALAVYYSQVGRRKLIVVFLLLTIVFGTAFLVIKYFEYKSKIDHHLLPFVSSFHWHGDHPEQARMFFWIYFAMTGLHASHMIIGIGALLVLAFYAYRGRYTPEYHSPVELTGLYWHFVDIVWIFLFPLLYLISRHTG
jgi:cytochrome c oxidase subunit III